MDALHRLSGPSGVRMGVGLMWIAGAVWNVFVTLPNAKGAWSDLGENATFGVYRWFFSDVVGAAPAFWTVLLVGGELGLGLLLLHKGQWARYGLIGSTLWSLFLFFLIWPYTLMMVLFAVLKLWLLRFEHPVSVRDLLHRPRLMRKGA